MSIMGPVCLRYLTWGTALGLSAACASQTPTLVDVPELSSSSVVARVPRGSVERLDVDKTVDAGLGAFLQRVSLEPVVQGEKFVGFRLSKIDPGLIAPGVDVQVGDLVTRANGHTLEAETEAFAAFEDLRTAPEIRLSLVRNGKPLDVVIPIVGKPKALPATTPADAGVEG